MTAHTIDEAAEQSTAEQKFDGLERSTATPRDLAAMCSAQVKEEPGTRRGTRSRTRCRRVVARKPAVATSAAAHCQAASPAGARPATPSPAILQQSIDGVRRPSGDALGLRRQLRRGRPGRGEASSTASSEATGALLLPNTAGCRTAREAITLAHMAPRTV